MQLKFESIVSPFLSDSFMSNFEQLIRHLFRLE